MRRLSKKNEQSASEKHSGTDEVEEEYIKKAHLWIKVKKETKKEDLRNEHYRTWKTKENK